MLEALGWCPRSVWCCAVALAGLVYVSPAQARTGCDPLPPPQQLVIDVGPSQVAQLAGIVRAAPSGSTIRLASGVYNLDGASLVFRTPNVTLRSATGNRDDVVLDGNFRNGAYVSREIISIFASDITIADVSIQRAWDHAVHITPPVGSNISGVMLHNVRIADTATQAVKINPTDAANHTDNGVIRCSSIELTDAGRPLVRNEFLPCYTGGIDAHRAYGWTVADNVIQGFWCPLGLAEHGIHFWNGSRDTLVERNLVVNNARGIGFGLGDRGHSNGVIRNNFVVAADPRVFASSAGFDVGIGLESAGNVKVLHNTVASTAPPFASIDWRFPSTTATITNNLATHGMRSRDGANAAVAGNLAGAPLSLFVDVHAADLRLRPEATQAINQGASVPAGDADDDIEGDSRLVGARDIGADEFGVDPTVGLTQRMSLTVMRAGAGQGRVLSADRAIDCGTSCSSQYGPGVVVALKAVPEFGSSFAGWTGTGCLETVVMDTNRVCTATFVNSGPTITRQPADRRVRAGAQTTFSIEAHGSGGLRYQWRRNGVNIPGATEPRYVTSVVTRRDSGARVQCIVSDQRGSVKSREASLVVRRRR
jgi:hypothetical protein